MSGEVINLKIHTQFSICEGAIKINQLSDFCKKNKITAVGICDNENLSGALEFSNELSKAGIQPIIGTNIFLREIVDNETFYGKISLFAKNAFQPFAIRCSISTRCGSVKLSIRPKYLVLPSAGTISIFIPEIII